MAVYSGARPQSSFLPRRSRVPETPTLPRRRLRGAVRAKRRANRLGFLLGGIVLAFLLAFFSLAQTMRVSATGYQIDRLASDHDQLVAAQQQLVSDLNRLGGASAIRKQAIDLGLAPLTNAVVVPAR